MMKLLRNLLILLLERVGKHVRRKEGSGGRRRGKDEVGPGTGKVAVGALLGNGFISHHHRAYPTAAPSDIFPVF
jgi:hypothetical protein